MRESPEEKAINELWADAKKAGMAIDDINIVIVDPESSPGKALLAEMARFGWPVAIEPGANHRFMALTRQNAANVEAFMLKHGYAVSGARIAGESMVLVVDEAGLRIDGAWPPPHEKAN